MRVEICAHCGTPRTDEADWLDAADINGFSHTITAQKSQEEFSVAMTVGSATLGIHRHCLVELFRAAVNHRENDGHTPVLTSKGATEPCTDFKTTE
jgi:hypothetical protein